VIRWLFSTVGVVMLFDDHDVHDDWNTSIAWLEAMRATDWWETRIESALASYWVYQHLGNLAPDELEANDLLAEVRRARDAKQLLLAGRGRRTIRAPSTRRSARPSATRSTGTRLARAVGVPEPKVRWRLVQPPTYDNQFATLELDGRSALLRIERTVSGDSTGRRIETSLERQLA